MKKVLFTVFAAAVVLAGGCTPVMKSRTLGPEEQEWADYLQEMYPGWKAPAALPQAITVSSEKVPYANKDLPDQQVVDSDADLPEIEEVSIEEEEIVKTPEEPVLEETEKKEEVTTETAAEKTPLVEEENKTEFTEYVVEKNDSLSIIAKKFYGDGNKFGHIYKANEDVIKDPNKLYPGMKLKIPVKK